MCNEYKGDFLKIILLGFGTIHKINNLVLQNGAMLNLNEMERLPKLMRSRRFILAEALTNMIHMF